MPHGEDTMQHGSLINQIAGTSPTLVPVVGMGATRMCWSDRYPYTVIAVSASGKTIKVQSDKYTRTDANGMSECQTYEYAPDPNGVTITVRLTKRGWYAKGSKFCLGSRSRYHDFSF